MPANLSNVKSVTLTLRNVTRPTYFFGATLIDAQHIRNRSILCKFTRQVLKINGLEQLERCPNIFPECSCVYFATMVYYSNYTRTYLSMGRLHN